MPTNLLDWQRVSSHLPEVKYIFGMGFWGGRYTNSIGVAEIPLRPLAVTLGLDPAALESGIKTLCSESLLVGDFDRFEFFISDWFRFHTFRKTGIAIARKQFLKTGSANLRNALLKAAPWLGGDNNLPCQEKDFVSKQSSKSPTAAATSTYSAAAEKIRIRRPSGIVTFTATDPERAIHLEQTYQADQIANAVRIVIQERNKEPVPGLVEKEIERQIAVAARKTRQILDAEKEKRHAESLGDAQAGIASAFAALGRSGQKGV